MLARNISAWVAFFMFSFSSAIFVALTSGLGLYLKETRDSFKIRPLNFEKKWMLNSEKCFLKYQ